MITVTRTDEGRTYSMGENTAEAARQAGIAAGYAASVAAIAEPLDAATGRAALYGFTDLPAARLFARDSTELDFSQGFYRDGLTALAYDPVTAAINAPGWTFARATPAWDVPDGGALTTFADDVPRITNKGLLIEGATTRSSLYATDFSSWSINNLTLVAGEVDPAGQAATKITVASGGGASLRSNGTGTASATGNTLWAVVKRGSGDTDGNSFAAYNSSTSTLLLGVDLNYKTGEITYTTGTSGARVTDLGGDWWLIELTVTAGVSAGDTLYFYTGFLGDTQSAGEFFYMSHAEIETLPFASSRVVTNSGAAETRAADVLSLDFDAAGDFTVFIEATMGAHKRRETLFAIDSGTTSNVIELYRDTEGMVKLAVTRGGATTTETLASKPSARSMRAVAVSRSGDVRVALDEATPVSLTLPRPIGLSRMWLGQSAAGNHLFGRLKRVMLLRRAASDAEARAMTANPNVSPLAAAPLVGHPQQSRFNPNTASTPDQVYGRQPIEVYGTLPCALLIAENSGPSAVAIGADGKVLWRDVTHRGRCVDVDPVTGSCIVMVGETYRTLAWLDRYGNHLHQWSLPGGVTGEIYGFRTNGAKLVVNTVSGANGETWIFNLDANGVPSDTGTAFAAFTGAGKQARSMLIDGTTLWLASTSAPTNPQGCEGELQAYDLAAGTLLHAYYGHYPNDVDKEPGGNIVWLDEHLDRLRRVDPLTDAVETVMAGLQVCADYEPAVGSISANILARRVTGSNLEAAAVEFAGRDTIYAPNGVTVISRGVYAIADTDNGRVFIARETATWKPEVVAVIGLLNEPTKVRVLP